MPSARLSVPAFLRQELPLFGLVPTVALFHFLHESWFQSLGNVAWSVFLFVWLFAAIIWGAKAVVRHADHLAGRLGVALFESLVARKAIENVSARGPVRKVHGALGPVALGPAAETVFARLGIDLAEAHGRKRHFATACQDWTEDRPHLGGALGAALLERLEDLEWVERQRGSRAMTITGRGRRGLSDLGLQLSG